MMFCHISRAPTADSNTTSNASAVCMRSAATNRIIPTNIVRIRNFNCNFGVMNAAVYCNSNFIRISIFHFATPDDRLCFWHRASQHLKHCASFARKCKIENPSREMSKQQMDALQWWWWCNWMSDAVVANVADGARTRWLQIHLTHFDLLITACAVNCGTWAGRSTRECIQHSFVSVECGERPPPVNMNYSSARQW